MQTAAPISDRRELPGMLATLCSYEGQFGPYHPHTLRLMAQVGIACRQAGELAVARPLLERAVRDTGRGLGWDHEVRLLAMAALRDLFAEQSDYRRAAAVQKELLDCQLRKLGSDHPDTLQTRAGLAAMLLDGGVQSPAAS
jgi:non-specific serine/threonine protein kinase/serine/threonine-protein kinase